MESHLNQEFESTVQLHKNVLENMTFSDSLIGDVLTIDDGNFNDTKEAKFLNSQSFGWSPKEEESRKIRSEIVLHCSKNSFGFLHPVVGMTSSMKSVGKKLIGHSVKSSK